MPTHPDHVTIVASDFERSLAIYDAALGALGFVRTTELEDEEEGGAPIEAAGWGNPGEPAVVWVVVGEHATRSAHLALRADDATAVRAFHEAAIGAGAAEHSAPRRWPIYRRGEFNAIVSDPDGNLVEVIAPED